MRWIKDIFECPKCGTTRVVRKFLIFPRTFNGVTKWFVNSEIEEIWDDMYGVGWTEIGFHDPNDGEKK